MKRILLTSTAMVMVAGIAAADGHSSMTWTGKAKAGIARNGTAAATGVVAKTATQAQLNTYLSAQNAGASNTWGTFIAVPGATVTTIIDTAVNTAATPTEIKNIRTATDQILATSVASSNTAAVKAAAVLAHKNANERFDAYFGKLAVAKADAGDFKAYSEVNATVTGTVTAGGMTLSAGVSVDAGTGYDFADDDTFDGAKTNGVGLDSVSLDMGSAGKLTLNDDAITHMVDSDDDATGDVSYTNTFGGATFTAVMDLEKDDSDLASSAAVKGKIALAADVVAGVAATATKAGTTAVVVGDWINAKAAVAADTQWSAKVSMPVGGGSVYVAMDEESGNAFGGSAVVSGMTLSIDSKLEALGSDIKSNRQNTIGVATTMGAVSGNFSYDSLKDGNQWSAGASYAAGDMTVGFTTNEASSWTVTGGYALGTGASIEAGVNYTEDAYLGLSFAF